MEEILASIRKIIAEDTSGSRTAPPVPPSSPLLSPRAGAKSVAAPQRGFMSREAFLHSSTPAAEEPASQRYFTPVSPHDPQPGAEKSSSTVKSEKADVGPAAEASGVEPTMPAGRGAAEQAKRDVHDVVEAKVTDETERRLRPSPAAADTKSETEAETAEVRHVEPLGEDLKVPLEAEKPDLVKPETEKRPQVESSDRVDRADVPQTRPSEPVAKSASAPARAVEPPAAEEPTKTPESQDSSDPFAFDLGPSPFLSRTAVERPAERPISIDPAPVNGRSSGRPRDEVPVYEERGYPKMNGSPLPQQPVRSTAPPSKSFEPSERVSTSSTAPGPSRPAPAFAVPSVSATLGPHRTLEPLADSFKPAPADHRSRPEVPPANPFPRRDFGLSSESPREPRHERPEAVLQPSEPLPPASSSMLDTTASLVGNGDRTMEDAVADLLRPLLKTWLAENMPKIVERALRREMTERLLPGQKNPRD
jgi:cell pole-organizing protein PopZ